MNQPPPQPHPPGQPWPPPPGYGMPPQGAYPPAGYPPQMMPGGPMPGGPMPGAPMPGAYPQMPMPVLAAGPINGTPRQWEARVRRMIRQGRSRDEIVFTMRESGWSYEQADDMIRRNVTKERWVAIWTIIGTGIVGVAGVLMLIAMLSMRHAQVHGGEIALIIFGISGFIYGLVRLVKIRA